MGKQHSATVLKVHGSSVPESFGYSLDKNESVGYIQVQGGLFFLL